MKSSGASLSSLSSLDHHGLGLSFILLSSNRKSFYCLDEVQVINNV